MKKFNITVNGQSYEVEVEELAAEGSAPVAAKPAPAAPKAAPKKKAPAKKAAPVSAGSVTAPMPGTINDVKVSDGPVSYTHLRAHET